MLEVNTLPARHLAQLVEAVGERAVCRELNVHPKTLYRWRTGRSRIPGRQHLAIRALLGDLPGTAGQWSGWRFHAGKLLSPGGDTYGPGDVLALVLLRQQLSAQRREIDLLRARVALLESGYPAAANESLRA